MANGPTRVCVFNVKANQQPAPAVVPNQTGSNLIDIVTGCDGAVVSSLGPASYGVPVVLNPNGVIDPSLLNTGVSAIAGVNLSLGAPLVHLYSVGGVLTAEYAEAGSGSPPSPALSAQGFLTTPIDAGQPGTIAFSGLFTYIDPNSEFSIGSVGQEVYLSSVTPGGITLIRPTTIGGILDQTVGYVVSFTAPNVVTVIFLAGYNDFSRISGVAQISQGGTAATTGAQALINLIGGSPSTGEALVWNGSAWTPSFAAETSFTDILTGTNITATMTVGTGASIVVSGSGIVEANQLWGVLVSSTPPSVNQALIATSGTAASWQTISYSIISGTPQLPQTFTPTLAGSPPEYEYLTGYNAGTGLFTAAPVPSGGGGTPGGSPTQIQYNLASTFAGIAGSSVTVAGTVALAPTGAGVALSVTGDTGNTRDVALFNEFGGPGLVQIDPFCNTNISPDTGGIVAALTVVGEVGGVANILSLSSAAIGSTITVEQAGQSALSMVFSNSPSLDEIVIFPQAFTVSNGIEDFTEIGVHSGSQGLPLAPSLVVYCGPLAGSPPTAGRTSPFAAISVWGDAYGNNIQSWFVNGSMAGGHPAVVPAVQIDTLGHILGGKPDYRLDLTNTIPDFLSYQATSGHRFVTTNSTPWNTASVTNVQITSSVVTLQAVNTFAVGDMVEFVGMTAATFLNGHTAKVLSTGLSGTQFEVEFSYVNYGPTADTGSALGYSVIESVTVLSQIDPSTGNQFVQGLQVGQAVQSTSPVLGGAQVFPQGINGLDVVTSHEGTGNITSVTPSASYPWYALVGASINVNNFYGASVPNVATCVLDIGQFGGSHIDQAFNLFLTSNGDATSTITNSYGIYIQRQNPSSATNRWAIFEVNPQEKNALGEVHVGGHLVAVHHTPYAYASPVSTIETGAGVNTANGDVAGQLTITNPATTSAYPFTNNYTGTLPPVVTVTATQNYNLVGGASYIWVTVQGVAGAWTGFTINVDTCTAPITFGYHVIGQA